MQFLVDVYYLVCVFEPFFLLHNSAGIFMYFQSNLCENSLISEISGLRQKLSNSESDMLSSAWKNIFCSPEKYFLSNFVTSQTVHKVV